jgi:hypothetical protein
MHLYNLILAAAWLVLGVALLVYERVGPGGVKVGDKTMWLGLVALLLACYNLVRGWHRWTSWRARRQHEELARQREFRRRARAFEESGRERDPNFIFDEPTKDQAGG